MIPPRTFEAFCIVNPYGSFWCTDVFYTPAAARAFIIEQCPTLKVEDFAFVPVVVTISVQIETPAIQKPATMFAPK